jgi:hypothetical protein
MTKEMQLLVRDMDDLMFGANEMSICKQDLILQEELNCETILVPKLRKNREGSYLHYCLP